MPTATIREVSTAGPARGVLVVRFIRRRPLLTFFLWAYTVGQVLPWWVMLAGLAERAWLLQGAVVGSTLVGLLLPALVITRITDGREGLQMLWGRALKVRLRPAWYAGALLLVPALTVAVGVLVAGPPASQSAPFLVMALVPHFLLPLMVTFVLVNWWEEVAWMGFVQARIQDRRGALSAALVVAPLFALQHSSLVAGQGVLASVLLMVLLAALAVPFRFAIGWAHNRTGSLFIVGLVHAVGNAATSGDGFSAGYLRTLYAGDTNVTMSHLLAMFVLGLVVVTATRGRLGRGTPQ